MLREMRSCTPHTSRPHSGFARDVGASHSVHAQAASRLRPRLRPAAAVGALRARVVLRIAQLSRPAAVVAGERDERLSERMLQLQLAEAHAALTEQLAVEFLFTPVQKTDLAGGTLHIIRLAGERMLRVWTPPGFKAADAGSSGHPVLYLNDGQNLFDDSMSMSGRSWRVAETCATLVTSGQLPPFVVVGIDHSGATRSFDYCPYTPGTGPGGVRRDAASWPGGGVQAYMERVVTEVLPFCTKQFNLSADPQFVAFGGSSFGGICTLYAAMRYPHVFGSVLVESPSLWMGDERMLGDLARHDGAWPQRTFVAMGGCEYSGSRPKDPQPAFDKRLEGYVAEVVSILASHGVSGPQRVASQVAPQAAHTEAAWAQRLPAALNFLLKPWWTPVLTKNAKSLYFTSPRKLKAGHPAVLFLNKARSTSLREQPSARLVAGFNNWQTGGLDAAMQPATGLPVEGAEGAEGADWWCVPFHVPADAYEMNLTFCDVARSVFDNCAGLNFYARVVLEDASGGGARLPLDQLARRNSTRLYFTVPEVPLAGSACTLYMNRQRSWPLANSPNVRLHHGFNHWQSVAGEKDLKPTSLWRDQSTDWWSVDVLVPPDAEQLDLAFTNGHGVWDNNDGNNFVVPVKAPKKALQRAREIEHVDSSPHAAGTLEVVTLSKRKGGDRASHQAKWTEEKRLRVWLPPGYSRDNAPPGGYPILYMNDGQNLFEDWLAHQGVSWRLGYTASELVTSGRVPPFIICALDSAGAMRSLNYLPYAPGSGVGGFRGDCERWPGGGLDAYLHRVVDEVMPLVRERYNTASEPAKVAFGGGSFAGITALQAALKFPHVFGAVLAESPSLWVTEGRFLGDLAAHTGRLPERLFLGCGTKEYSATRDHEREDVDALLLHYYREAARILEHKGMRADRLRFLVEDGAGHHELAWQWRLTGALEFLLAPWWDA